MDARFYRAGILLAATLSLAANYGSYSGTIPNAAGSFRSEHFVVSAPTAQFAREVCEAAERFRHELALEWLGTELPPWHDLCPIQVTVGQQLGAGGATSFTFINGEPREWHMDIQGSRERILDSVLPHEITHTIFATHFGRPLPRWADEGASTSVEHSSERSKQEQWLIKFLTNDRGIAFNQMFAMKDYPRDILPLYSQGYSLARYLIAQGGKRKFVQYVGDGMAWNNWTAATQKHYGIRSLHELQTTWLDWVRKGSPEISMSSAIAATSPSDPVQPMNYELGEDEDRVSGLVPLPSPVTPRQKQPAFTEAAAAADPSFASSGELEGWYRRQRDQARQNATDPAADSRAGTSKQPIPNKPIQHHLGRPQAPQVPDQIILEWSRTDPPRTAGSGTVWR